MKFSTLGLLAGIWLVIFLPHNPVALVAALVLLASSTAVGVWGFLKDGKQEAIECARQAQIDHIRALEKELGFSPLDLGEVEKDTK